MKYILSREEMRSADSRTADIMHVPSAVLMERAALLTAGQVIKRLDNINVRPDEKKVLIVCGPGNNGGDGFACGRILIENGVDTHFYFIGSEEKMSPLEREQYLSIKALKPDTVFDSKILGNGYSVIVDAIFGISLKRDVEGEYADAIADINDERDRGAYVISIDIPSGIDADSALVMGNDAVCADETVVCAFLKPGNALFPGAFYNGEIILAQIGITEKSLIKRPHIMYLEDYEIVPPERYADSNKGSYGKVFMVAGSSEVAGAAVLSAKAALKSGCGMVKVLTHENNRTALASVCPESLISTYGDESDRADGGQTSLFDAGNKGIEDKIKEAVAWSDVIAIGPGIGTGARAGQMLKCVLREAGDRCVVLDADALNIIAENTEILSEAKADIIITPHLKEMSRLTGIAVKEIKSHIMDVAADFAKSYHVTVVLKDSRSVSAFKSGNIVVNLKGNNGMATAGSGDVLTGVIASLAAQGLSSEMSACLGVSLHALAGDSAAEKYGKAAVTATDIIGEIR